MATNGIYVKKGDYIWLLPETKNEFDVPKAARVLSLKGNKVQVQYDDGKTELAEVRRMLSSADPPGETVEDMTALTDLQEHTILRNLHLRYLTDHLYTNIGWILVAVNPYRELPIYSEREIRQYQGKMIGQLPPHIYGIGAQCIINLNTTGNSQCVIISGETGAGKTESTKLLLKFIAFTSGRDASISNKIIQSNPVLEAFGNARTAENDNSSRFGKYVEMYLKEDGSIAGGRVQHFLLERARVLGRQLAPTDTNYHVFYTLLGGLSSADRNRLHLQSDPDHYAYLGRTGGSAKVHGKNEAGELQNLRNSLTGLGFSPTSIWDLMKTLAVIVHLGNLKFEEITVENIDAVKVGKNENLRAVLSLLEVPEETLLEALTKKNIFVGGSHIVALLSKESACSNRDGFVTTLYGHQFQYILSEINKVLFNQSLEKKSSIGILDIFGFENFEINSFEQLCINFSNEYLQQFFVQNVFKMEQAEYKKEGIKFQEFEYDDNQNILDLLGFKQMSILNLIDEQSKFPKGSDKGFLLRANELYQNEPSYLAAKADVKQQFGIKHYAGVVVYTVTGFLEKNHSDLSPEWVQVVKASKSDFLKEIFANQLASFKKTSVPLTVQYRRSLDSLMKTLQSCNPFFVRCLKPNLLKQPKAFDQQVCCRQLRNFGFLATVKMRKAGYPVRYTFQQFIRKYHSLLTGMANVSDRNKTILICDEYFGKGNYPLGVTKVFLKRRQEFILETEKNKYVSASATVIQKNWRRYILRKRFCELRKGALTLQKHWRAREPRMAFARMRQGVMRLQAVIRTKQLVATFIFIRSRITKFQAHCRGFIVRKTAQKKKVQKKVKKVAIVDDTKFLDKWITGIFEDALENKTVGNGIKDKKVVLKIEKKIDSKYSEQGSWHKKERNSFSQFARANFQGNVDYKFSNSVLTQPLLPLSSPTESSAAVVLWKTILRFMGDLAEPTKEAPKTQPKVESVMRELMSAMPTDKGESEFSSTVAFLNETGLAGSRQGERNKLGKTTKSRSDGSALEAIYQHWLNDKRSTHLEKVHFIIGHAILQPNLRDEIYCQICKQLNDNPSGESVVLGWVLMYLCCSTFAPTERLAASLLQFLSSGADKMGALSALQRTLTNGTRTQPPSFLELKCVKRKMPIMVEVQMTDDEVVQVVVDPAATAAEVCSVLCRHRKLKTDFGFSLFISIFGEESCLGWGRSHLMDKVSEREQYAKERGLAETDAPWQLMFRKEVFSPCEHLLNDPHTDNLVYHQLIKGISTGRYTFNTDLEAAQIVAVHCYLSYGPNIHPDMMMDSINEIVPKHQINEKRLSYWSTLVKKGLKESFSNAEKMTEEEIKKELSQMVKLKWPLHFSKFFEIDRLSGVMQQNSPVLLAVNSQGVCLVKRSSPRANPVTRLSYLDIKECSQWKKGADNSHQLFISTAEGKRLTMQTKEAKNISALINYMIEELKRNSKYVIAIEKFVPPDESFLSLEPGELAVVEVGAKSSWLRGHKPDTMEWGQFPASTVSFLPAVTPPPSFRLKLDQILQDQLVHQLPKGKHNK